MKKKIGPYELIRPIAKGGMGEVFLAYDPDCRREIALKCIRSEYLENKTIYRRFMKEAYIASQLTHPSIIPIYALAKDDDLPYYTMPFIDGKNLKKILVETLNYEKDPQNVGTPVGSISSLSRIFCTICEAVAYAHSQQIIHRDLKPENILIGKYGEVLIFDWGVADKIQNIANEDPSYAIEETEFPNLTSPGKIIGTLSFLAPERFKGAPSNYQTDIYSLGIMLYMILTLKLPFQRRKLKEAKENVDKEVFKNPIEVAPYRDIPHALVKITQKCLEPDPQNRYKTMDELLDDLRNFLRGNSEWISKGSLKFTHKSDWGFHENILMPKHQAISDQKDAFEWVCMMISKSAYTIHSQIELTINFKKNSEGIGLILNANPANRRVYLFEGYQVWLSTNQGRPSKLFRNNVEILPLPHLILKPSNLYHIKFFQYDSRIILEINGERQFSYLSYLPLLGKHVGLVYRDNHFKLSDLNISISSPSLVISCLDVPKAFLANHHYDKALLEYRKIGHAFPGRHESREAFFRGGLCLIKKAESLSNPTEQDKVLDAALHEFENLRNTPGAPLEYLGKALVYFAQKDTAEELKCIELAIRKYPKHPLLYLIYDHIIYRMYQSSHTNRYDTHEFILLALRYNAYAQRKQMIDPLILHLTERKGQSLFLQLPTKKPSEEDLILHRVILLSVLLGRSYVLKEILSNSNNKLFLGNLLIALWCLKEKDFASEYLHFLDDSQKNQFMLLDQNTDSNSLQQKLLNKSQPLDAFSQNILFLLLEKNLFQNQQHQTNQIIDKIESEKIEIPNIEAFTKLKLENALIAKDFQKAKVLLDQLKALPGSSQFDTIFLEGCLIHGEKGQDAAIEFYKSHNYSPIPNANNLGQLYLIGDLDIEKWKPTAFAFEEMSLYRQLYIYYACGSDTKMAEAQKEQWRALSYYS